LTRTGDLILRRHSENGVESAAIYSSCERYRYDLTRVWDNGAPRLFYVMLNPSKATELRNDPTIERCQRRAVQLGYGAMRIGNIFAWRETSPKLLKTAKDPVGTDTDRLLVEGADWADDVLCAWGAHGTHLDRGQEAARLLRSTKARLVHLGLTKEGHPRHPLYVAYAATPRVWMGS
jgi:hypothetical protein